MLRIISIMRKKSLFRMDPVFSEGKPVMEVLQELPQELPVVTHERTYAQVVVGH